MQDEKVYTLMTGGWDSTFRLLQLLLIEKRAVQPVYIIDSKRWTLIQELKAMAGIKKATLTRFPDAAPLLLPTRMYHRQDIQPDPDIEHAYAQLMKRAQFGAQYEWIARAAKQFGLTDAELCIEKGIERPAGFRAAAKDTLAMCEDGSMRVPESRKGTPEHTFLGVFSFPIYTITKQEMRDIAREHGFLDILELAWFCHRPNILGQACGTCNPCQLVMTEGMSYRVPAPGRLRFYAKRILDPRPWLRKSPVLFNALKRLKENLTR